MEQRAFGANSKGDAALLYTFTNKNGMMIGVTDLGATLHAVLVPDRDGSLCDVVLGYDTAEQYEEGATFFGATVGRSANRIGGASFVLNIIWIKMTVKTIFTAGWIFIVSVCGK